MKIQITANIDKATAKVLRKDIRAAFQNQLWAYERNSAYGVSDLYGRDNSYPRGVVAKVSEYNESEGAEVEWIVKIVETPGSFRTIYHDAKLGLHFSAYEWDRARW